MSSKQPSPPPGDPGYQGPPQVKPAPPPAPPMKQCGCGPSVILVTPELIEGLILLDAADVAYLRQVNEEAARRADEEFGISKNASVNATLPPSGIHR